MERINPSIVYLPGLKVRRAMSWVLMHLRCPSDILVALRRTSGHACCAQSRARNRGFAPTSDVRILICCPTLGPSHTGLPVRRDDLACSLSGGVEVALGARACNTCPSPAPPPASEPPCQPGKITCLSLHRIRGVTNPCPPPLLPHDVCAACGYCTCQPYASSARSA